MCEGGEGFFNILLTGPGKVWLQRLYGLPPGIPGGSHFQDHTPPTGQDFSC